MLITGDGSLIYWDKLISCRRVRPFRQNLRFNMILLDYFKRNCIICWANSIHFLFLSHLLAIIIYKMCLSLKGIVGEECELLYINLHYGRLEAALC